MISGEACLGTIGNDPQVAVLAPDRLRHCRLRRGGRGQSRRNQVRVGSQQTVDSRVAINRLEKVQCVIANVPSLKHGAASNLALKPEGPFMRFLRPKVRGDARFVKDTWIEHAGL